MQLRKGCDGRSSLTVFAAHMSRMWGLLKHGVPLACRTAWKFKSDPPKLHRR